MSAELEILKEENARLKEKLAVAIEALNIYAARDCFEFVKGKIISKETVKLIYGLGDHARSALAEVLPLTPDQYDEFMENLHKKENK